MAIEHTINNELSALIHAKQIDLLYKNQSFAIYSTLFLVSLVFSCFYDLNIIGTITICYSLFLLVILYRYIINRRYILDCKNHCVDIKQAYRLHLIGIIMSGLAWALTIVLLFSLVDFEAKILFFIVVLGFSSAAYTTIGYKLVPLNCYILLLTLPFIYVVYDEKFLNYQVLIITIIFHAAFVMRSSYIFYKSIYNMLYLNEIAAQHEKELEIQTAEANAANKYKTEFLSRMSHELRTPLNAVLGMNELLLRDTKDSLSDRQKNRLLKVEEAGNHLLTLVDDVLDLSRVEVGGLSISLDLTDCHAVINEAIKLVEYKAFKRNITISTEFSNKTLYILADAKRLKQIVVNLLDNAVKYNKPNGLVSVITRIEKDVFVKISVIDTGFGITEDSIDKLFIPFSRLSEAHSGIEGAGIGLNLCKRLVELMNGRIGIQCQQGGGSCFWFELPYVKQRGYFQESLDRDEPDIHFNGPIVNKILLVEDNQVNREVAIDMLEEMGCDVDVAVDGKQAVEAFNNHKYELILMDCEMPVMNGFIATKEIRKREKTLGLQPITIIALTAHAVAGAKEKCLNYGMNDFLSKPFNISTLNMILKKWLDIGFVADELRVNESIDSEGSASTSQEALIKIQSDTDIIDMSVVEQLKSRRNKNGISLLDKVISAYLNQSSNLLKNLTIATEQSDVELVRTVTHALKSSSVNVGATGLSKLCKEIEFHCEQGEIINILVEQVYSAYSDVEFALTEILQDTK